MKFQNLEKKVSYEVDLGGKRQLGWERDMALGSLWAVYHPSACCSVYWKKSWLPSPFHLLIFILHSSLALARIVGPSSLFFCAQSQPHVRRICGLLDVCRARLQHVYRDIRGITHSFIAKMSFDEIFDLTAGVYFHFL